MDERGWQMVLHEDESLEVVEGVPDAQMPQFTADWEACLALHRQEPLPRSERIAGWYHDSLVDASTCLQDLGYEVPEAPSRQAAIESMLSGSIIDPLWDPYEYVFTGDLPDGTSIESVMEQCPPPVWGVR